MRRLLLLALAASALHAASIRGAVVENMSGRPLARTLVALAPLPGSPGRALSVRTNLSGSFEFVGLPAGEYLVSAARAGFAPVEYGQKEFHSAGLPIVVEESTATFLEIRMKRFGAIAGTVLDENDVGIPDTNVVAYRDTRPPQLVGHATADDRGMYRISGLPPGRYLVRTAAKQFEDGGYAPTFSRQSATVEEAQAVDARLDELTDDANVRVLPGALLSLSGSVSVSPRQQVTVTLVSEMGRETFSTSSEFHFGPLAPGRYELFAEAPSSMLGTSMLLTLDRDRSDIQLTLSPVPAPQINIQSESSKPVTRARVQVLARRVDLAGVGPTEVLRSWLAPGRWELMVAPMPNYYVSGFSFTGSTWGQPGQRADLWNRVGIESGFSTQITVALASNPGSLEGMVTADHAAAVGAMVFLEPWDSGQHKRLGDVRTVRADMRGHYQFHGLAPGDYRVMATFEYQMPEEAEMDRAETRVVKAEAGANLGQDLDLFVIR
jgi:hypothetical protein